MPEFIRSVAAVIRVFLRSRTDTAMKVIALRQQLAVLLWLCDHTREQMDERFEAHKNSEPVWYDPVESTWGWDARMAKILARRGRHESHL